MLSLIHIYFVGADGDGYGMIFEPVAERLDVDALSLAHRENLDGARPGGRAASRLRVGIEDIAFRARHARNIVLSRRQAEPRIRNEYRRAALVLVDRIGEEILQRMSLALQRRADRAGKPVHVRRVGARPRKARCV